MLSDGISRTVSALEVTGDDSEKLNVKSRDEVTGAQVTNDAQSFMRSSTMLKS